jgi:hypothetical protein
MNTQAPRSIIPVYTSRGDPLAYLAYPHLFNRSGEWIGWVTSDREVYSVLGLYVGYLTNEPRILRKRITSTLIPRRIPPSCPPKLAVPATIPLAPLLAELRFGLMDVLLEDPDRLHTLDAGDLRQDLD